MYNGSSMFTQKNKHRMLCVETQWSISYIPFNRVLGLKSLETSFKLFLSISRLVALRLVPQILVTFSWKAAKRY